MTRSCKSEHIEYFKCHQQGHMKKDCLVIAREGQVVKVFTQGVIANSSVGPSVEDKGNGHRE